MVLLVWRLRGPRQADVRARHVAHPRSAGHSDRDGQGIARRGVGIRGRHRRRPARVVDATGSGPARLRGHEAMTGAHRTSPMRIQLSPERRSSLVDAVEDYMRAEFDVELGVFRAEGLVDLFVAELGPPVYNQAFAV